MNEYAPRPMTQKSREAMLRRLCATVLTFEGLVVFFGALVAARLSGVGQETSLAVGGGLALLCILSSGAMRSPHAVAIVWAVQGMVLATGFIVTAMFFMGAIFVALWVAALRIGAMVAPR